METNLNGSIADQMAVRLPAIKGSVNQAEPIKNPFPLDFLREGKKGNVAFLAKIFAIKFKNRFLINKTTGTWMIFTGQHWEDDERDLVRVAALEVANVWIDGAKEISQNIKDLPEGVPERKKLEREYKEFMDLAFRLCDVPLLTRMLILAGDMMASSSDEFDKTIGKVACPNCVINLKNGIGEDGDPADRLKKAAGTSYPADGILSSALVWEKTLLEVFGSSVVVDFFRRLIGYALMGGGREAVFVVMVGKGRNGKSLIMEIINKALGQLSAPISSNMLMAQPNRNPGACSPDIMALMGILLAYASESADGKYFAEAMIKLFTGGDTLIGRNPHDKKETRFSPHFLLFLLTNHKPHVSADEYAVWERMILITFPYSFVDREPRDETERRADHGLKKKLEAELPEILAWMVKGCLEYQRDGLNIPSCVKAANEEYQRDEDILADFLEQECVLRPELSISGLQIYTSFENWWIKNVSQKAPSNRRFGEWLTRRFKKKKGRTVTYYGLALAADSNLFE